MTTEIPDDDHEYQERAGILEFDAGLSRTEAELKAREIHPTTPPKVQFSSRNENLVQRLRAMKANEVTP